jgi:general secretion pathway protein D
VFDSRKEGAGKDLVRFQPISRLNAVLAVSQRAELIARVQRWVQRLDSADYENTSLRVYRVRFGNAKVMANILREVFTGDVRGYAGGLAGNVDLAQLTPGSMATRATVPAAAPPPVPTGQPADAGTRTGNPAGDPQEPGGPTVDPVGLASTSAGGRAPTLPNVRITADTSNNALLIYASREQYKIVERAIVQLDRPALQVAIDATIAEITLNKNLQYGIQYFLQSRDIGLKPDKGSISYGASDVLKRLIPGFNLLLGPEADPRLVIDAFRQVTSVKVLSSPSLVVLDNQIATLQVGDQVPIATRSSQSVENPNAPLVNNIEMRNTGVILRVTPRINVNGVVTLDVEQEISNVVNPAAATLTPTISQRRVKSSIAVASGQTVLLGGLISSRQQQDRSGLPVPLPLNIIGSNAGGVENTELIIFIRPQIIRDGLDAQLVAEELRSKLQMVGRSRAPLVPDRRGRIEPLDEHPAPR